MLILLTGTARGQQQADMEVKRTVAPLATLFTAFTPMLVSSLEQLLIELLKVFGMKVAVAIAIIIKDLSKSQYPMTINPSMDFLIA